MTSLAEWLEVDDAYGAQMALRDHLLSEARAEVLAMRPGAEAAVAELYAHVVDWLRMYGGEGFVWGRGTVRRPDGVTVPLDERDPLGTLGRLLQEDLCLLQRVPGAEEHILSAAILCFPASWTLSEKMDRPLTRIHAPVPSYDAGIAIRVQRIFDHLQVAQPVWRQNALLYHDPALYQPRPEAAPRQDPPGRAGFLRSERQCLLRLGNSRAIVFSIHTHVVPRAALPPDMATRLTDLETV